MVCGRSQIPEATHGFVAQELLKKSGEGVSAKRVPIGDPADKTSMKHAAVVAALVCLAACIKVDDFGAYWDRASIDRGLVGDWKQVAATPEQTRSAGYGIGGVMRIAIKGDAYEVTSFDDAGTQRDAPLYPARTLVVGPYRFLAYGRINGMMEPYRLEGRTLTFCGQLGPATRHANAA